MGADLMICFDCPVKAKLGSGTDGTLELLRLKKQKSQAESLVETLRGSGDQRALKDIPIGLRVLRPDRTQEKEQTLQDMIDESAKLDSLAPICSTCQANLFDDSFGCWGYVNYPITESGEEWMMARLQPASTLGGRLLLKAIADFDYDGATFARFRANGVCERKTPVVTVVKKAFLSSTKVTADQVFQGIFALSEPMNAGHCMLVLLWLGALLVDGKVPADPNDPTPLMRLTNAETPAQRMALGKLSAGETSDDPGIFAMQRMLAAMHRSWVLDVPLFVDG
jgi:hypothetical protein